MKIGFDMGHTTSGAGTGAYGCGYYEHVLNRELGKLVMDLLKKEGHTIVNITVDKSNNQINDRVKKANAQKLDMLISLHFNSGRKDPNGDGKTGGVEVLTYDNKTLQTESKRVCEKIAKIGFTNRGVKIRPDLGILRDTYAKAMLIEVCFIDDKDDMNRYVKNVQSVAKAIVEGVLGKAISEPVKPPTTPPTTSKHMIKIKIDGKVYELEGMLVDGYNYLKVAELKKAGYTVTSEGSMAIVNKPS